MVNSVLPGIYLLSVMIIMLSYRGVVDRTLRLTVFVNLCQYNSMEINLPIRLAI